MFDSSNACGHMTIENTAPSWLEQHPRSVLKRHGVRAKKGLGQRFLVSAGNLDRIVEAAAVAPDETVLEIGTGLGRLTACLAARAGRVVTVDIDKAMCRIAESNLSSFHNVTLLCCDFLESKHRINPIVTEAAKSPCQEHPAPLKVVSNPPYSISSPATVNLLEWEVEVGELYLMLQKEVADRLAARPGTRDYGPLTVYVDYWATVEKLFSLPRGAFWPQPEVSSALVKIVRRQERRKTEAYPAFAAVVRKLFTGRRKTVAHALRAGWGKEKAVQILARLGLDPRTRIDSLRTEDFEAIAALAGPPHMPS